MFRLRKFLLAPLLLAGCATPIPAPSPRPPQAPLSQTIRPASWRAVDAATGRITALAELQALATAFPESASVQRRLLSAAVREGNAGVVRDALGRLEAMGYALRPQSLDALTPLLGQAVVDAAKARSTEAAKQAGVSVELATPAPDLRLIEGVAWDDRRHRMFLSSVVERQLFTMDDNRGKPVPGVDGGSLSGMTIDQERGLLWLASGVVEQTPSPETAFRGLIAVDLDRLAPVRRVAAPEGAEFPSDIGLGPDGTVYVSDAMRGAIYRLWPGADAMETLVAPGTLRSPQGIAVHPGGRWLYVSDYSYGIAIVDLATGAVGRLAASTPMMLDGTDGLYWFDGGLVAIQNGTSPMRIVRIHLEPSGSGAAGLTVVEANHPEWGEPTIGQVNGKDLIYVSDPQWDRFGPGGAIKGGAPLRPNRIRVTPLKDEPTPPPRR